MWQTEDAALYLAMDRLEWALGTLLGRDARAWCDRVSRGLAQVRTALDRHAAQVESREGLFARVADRDLLPFTEPVRQVRTLCQEHRNLRVAVAGLQALLDEGARRLDFALQTPNAPVLLERHEQTALRHQARREGIRLEVGIFDRAVPQVAGQSAPGDAQEDVTLRGVERPLQAVRGRRSRLRRGRRCR